jgi:hypothetical protein
MTELKLALRRFGRHPGRLSAIALTLAIGIGAVSAAFAAVDGVLLRGLPVEDPASLVMVWYDWPARDFVHVPSTPEDFRILSQGVPGFSAMAGVASAGPGATLVDGVEGSYVIDRVQVAGDFFGLLGAVPAYGRLLSREDDAPGADPVIVLSYRLWTRFGSDPAVIGSVLPHNGLPFRVVGVAGRGFDLPHGTEAWVTYRGAHLADSPGQPCCIEMDLIGRLSDGATPVSAGADIAAVMRANQDPERAALYAELEPVVTGLEEHVLGSLRPVL